MLKQLFPWVGGKSRELKYINNFPKKINNYYEPFLGGGSLFFHIHQNVKPKQTIISDNNPYIINAFLAIQKDYKKITTMLKYHYKHSSKEYFDKLKNLINSKYKPSDITKLVSKGQSDEKVAAIFIYLLRAAFKSYFRINYQKDKIFTNYYITNVNNIMNFNFIILKNIHNYLKNIKIYFKDYTNIKPKKNDLVILDPPYINISINNYTTTDFEYNKFIKFVINLDKIGCNIVLFNNYNKDLIKIFKNFKVQKIKTYNTIKSNNRTDIMLTNF